MTSGRTYTCKKPSACQKRPVQHMQDSSDDTTTTTTTTAAAAAHL
jgi:hypothetical protein